MPISERDRIKKKVLSFSPESWKADPFDVRYYLASKIKLLSGKRVLDVGAGPGILSSEIPKNNFRVMIELNTDKIKRCQKIDSEINVICASFTNLPFKDEVFDTVISSHTIELAKSLDVKQKKLDELPNTRNYLKEINRVMQKGKIYLTTPNNAYHKAAKPEYYELKKLFTEIFSSYKIWFFNTGKKLSKNRKFDFSNVMPKLKSKIQNPDDIIQSMIKEKSTNNYSRYFYAEVEKT